MLLSSYGIPHMSQILPRELPEALGIYDYALGQLREEAENGFVPVFDTDKKSSAAAGRLQQLFRSTSALMCQAVNYGAYAVTEKRRLRLTDALRQERLDELVDPSVKANLVYAVMRDMAARDIDPLESALLKQEDFQVILDYARKRSESIRQHSAMKEKFRALNLNND